MNDMNKVYPSLIRFQNPFPRQFWLGLALIALFWPLNWLLDGRRTHILFFPLWLGYCLAVDGLVYARRGNSLLSRDWRAYMGLFMISAPAWWLFEFINWRTQNWEYLGDEPILWLRILWKSMSFSTVIPAVFGTAELVCTFGWLKKLGKWLVIPPTRPVTSSFFVAGLLMLTALLVWPAVFFPLIWFALFFVSAPLNVWLGYPSLAEYTRLGNWRPVVALILGALICGFFWEMWNYYAYPKWVYHVKPFEFFYIFEMPLLGYGGYLPFGLETFALYHLICGLLGLSRPDYLQIDD